MISLDLIIFVENLSFFLVNHYRITDVDSGVQKGVLDPLKHFLSLWATRIITSFHPMSNSTVQISMNLCYSPDNNQEKILDAFGNFS